MTWGRDLRDLLLSLFSTDELARFVRDVAPDLRVDWRRAPVVVADAVVAELTLRGAVDDALFVALRGARPQRLADIDRVSRAAATTSTPEPKSLRDIPAVRKLAEEMARQRWIVGTEVDAGPGSYSSSVIASEFLFRASEIELRLLTDLSRPASRDAVARLVASNLAVAGWEAWQVSQAIDDGGDAWADLLDAAGLDDPDGELGRLNATDALTTIALAVLR